MVGIKTVLDLKIKHFPSVCIWLWGQAVLWCLELIKNKYCHDGPRMCKCSNNIVSFKNCNPKVFFKCNISVKARDRKMDISIEWP